MKKQYWIKYITVKEPLWASQEEAFIDAENFNDLLMQLDKKVNQKFYILAIYEKFEDRERAHQWGLLYGKSLKEFTGSETECRN